MGGEEVEGIESVPVELHAGKETWEKKTTMLWFTHTNNPNLSSSCDKSSWV